MDLFPSLLGEKQSKQKQKGKDVFSAVPDLTAVDGRGVEGHGQNVDPNPAGMFVCKHYCVHVFLKLLKAKAVLKCFVYLCKYTKQNTK